MPGILGPAGGELVRRQFGADAMLTGVVRRYVERIGRTRWHEPARRRLVPARAAHAGRRAALVGGLRRDPARSVGRPRLARPRLAARLPLGDRGRSRGLRCESSWRARWPRTSGRGADPVDRPARRPRRRLEQGDYARETRYDVDPVEVARGFEAAGRATRSTSSISTGRATVAPGMTRSFARSSRPVRSSRCRSAAACARASGSRRSSAPARRAS